MSTTASLDVFVSRQKATTQRCPSRKRLTGWVMAALQVLEATGPFALTIRFVDAAEGRALNDQYRHKNYATNVLSFPYDVTDLPELARQQERYLGDLVICLPVLQREAAEQGKSLTAHMAHLVIHGVLHLMGFDHDTETAAADMEALEIRTLHRLNMGNPYESDE